MAVLRIRPATTAASWVDADDAPAPSSEVPTTMLFGRSAPVVQAHATVLQELSCG